MYELHVKCHNRFDIWLVTFLRKFREMIIADVPFARNVQFDNFSFFVLHDD